MKKRFRVRSGLDFEGIRQYWLEQRGLLWGWTSFGHNRYTDSAKAIKAAKNAELAFLNIVTISH